MAAHRPFGLNSMTVEAISCSLYQKCIITFWTRKYSATANPSKAEKILYPEEN